MTHYTIDYRSLERWEAFKKAALDTREYLGPEATIRLRNAIRQAYDEGGIKYAYRVANIGCMLMGVRGYYPISGFIRWALKNHIIMKELEQLEVVEGPAGWTHIIS